MHVMTPNPIHVFDKDKASDALATMTERRFRHLPVISQVNTDDLDDQGETSMIASDLDSSTNVVGLLDITKCVFDKLHDLERKVNEDSNIILAMEALERRGSLASDQVDNVKANHGCPDLAYVIATLENAGHVLPEISVRASVRDAARIMKERHSTAVLVLNHAGDGNEFDKLAGIFTTKDVVLRVLASNLDPNTTTVVRVMTPHPDSCTPQTTILDALKKLHIGHYLHLPILDGEAPVGLVDVQQLTMAMLDYLVKKQESSNSAESGPMWGKFWNSTLVEAASAHEDEDTNSEYSAPTGQNRPQSSRSPSVLSINNNPQSMIPQSMIPQSTAAISRVQSVSGSVTNDEFTFPFKIKDGSRVLYLTTLFQDFSAFSKAVSDKVGRNVSRVVYEDEEGDQVCIECERDLLEAVQMARRGGRSKVSLVVGGGSTVEKGGSGGGVEAMFNDFGVVANVACCVGIVIVGGWIFRRLVLD